MIIFPAIDLKDGKVVRLRQGKAEDMTVYSDSPAAQALEWQRQGGQYLHLVDLDGAFTGQGTNINVISEITKAVSIPCQMGGGIRDRESAKRAFDAGISRVIVGTKACESVEFVSSLVKEFGADRVAVGIDAQDGKVAVQGWTESGDWDPVQLAQAVSVAGVETVIYTDISTDGMLKGPNLPAMEQMVQAVDARVIASGGVSVKEDITHLAAIKGLHGVIVGKALYDGRVNLPEILNLAKSS